jgi:homogentisate 1,2-dioxygenase
MHLCMTPHGPDTAAFEAAISSEDSPQHLGRDTLAFMFETHATPRVTAAALSSPSIDRNYYKCWLGLRSHFDRNWFNDGQGQQQQQQQQQHEGRSQLPALVAEANGNA